MCPLDLFAHCRILSPQFVAWATISKCFSFVFLLGDPAGARLKPGSGYGYGFGIRVDSPLGPLRLEYAFNDKHAKRFHFGVGHRN